MIIENPEVIFDSIDNGIIILDKDLTVKYWNKWLSLRINIDLNTILNNKITDLFPYINEKRLKRKIKSSLIINTPSFYSVEPHKYLIKINQDKITSKVYNYMRQNITLVPYNIEEGEVCIYIYDSTNISEVNSLLTDFNENLESKVKQGIEKLREKDSIIIQKSKLASMGEMIGAIAHQWRQPLNALGAHIQFIEDDYDDNLIDKKYIKQFSSETMDLIRFMSNTIDDFRKFYSTNKIKEPFEVKNKLGKTAKLIFKELIKDHVAIDYKGNDFIAFGFANEFQQVILSILKNSFDAFRLNSIEYPKIDISFYTLMQYGYIEIIDNAGGIPEKILERIFEPYFTTKGNSGGTGLGLYLSKKIIEENMNGELSVSNYYEGVKFIIKLELYSE